MPICIVPKTKSAKLTTPEAIAKAQAAKAEARSVGPTPPAQHAKGYRRYDPWMPHADKIELRKKENVAVTKSKNAAKQNPKSKKVLPLFESKADGKPQQERLYLAYGSNLSFTGMRGRCPNAQPRGFFLMKDAELTFRGVADVVYQPGAVVPVGMWAISARDERALDSYEGYRSNAPERGMYNKIELTLSDGRTAMMYVMNSEGVYPPSQYYVDVIRQGYRNFGIDERHLDEAIKRSYMQKAPDEQTEQRRLRQRASEQQATLVAMPLAVQLKRIEAARQRAGVED